MTEREDNVYKAKLAEQAERYDGKWWALDGYMPDNLFQLASYLHFDFLYKKWLDKLVKQIIWYIRRKLSERFHFL